MGSLSKERQDKLKTFKDSEQDLSSMTLKQNMAQFR